MMLVMEDVVFMLFCFVGVVMVGDGWWWVVLVYWFRLGGWFCCCGFFY